MVRKIKSSKKPILSTLISQDISLIGFLGLNQLRFTTCPFRWSISPQETHGVAVVPPPLVAALGAPDVRPSPRGNRLRCYRISPVWLELPSGKLTWLAGKSPFFYRKYIDSIRVHFPASYVSLPEGTWRIILIPMTDPWDDCIFTYMNN